MAARKRTIDAFFGSPVSKKAKPAPPLNGSSPTATKSLDDPEHAITFGKSQDAVPQEIGSLKEPGSSHHPTYPFPIAHLPAHISSELSSLPSSLAREINDQPDLDLVYYEPYIPRSTARDLFRHLRSSLPFYRVEYDINRGGVSTHIRTPRWTTVFGLDDTSRFAPDPSPSTSNHPPNNIQEHDNDGISNLVVVDTKTSHPVDLTKEKLYSDKYTHPRPLPKCLNDLRLSTEAATGCSFNFCLVNYYASGSDSISFHSDDERFLGPLPAIASFSLGARRDFVMKHKPPMKGLTKDRQGNDLPGAGTAGEEVENKAKGIGKQEKPLKLPLGSGDMILMRGTTQANWLHSIPKRSGKNEADGGRINITFRRAMVKGGTDNYYRYNVGTGPVYTWDEGRQEMRLWNKEEDP